MHPFLFEIFGFKVYSYGIVMVASFIFCFTLAVKYSPKNLLSQQNLLNFCLILMAALLIGTKLTGMIIHSDFSPQAWLNLLKFWQAGSFSFFPTVLLAISLIYIYCRLKSIPFLKIMDHLLPFAILAIGLQRTFGCFLAGCCYGKPTNLPWGMVFPEISRAGRYFSGIPIHPIQLYYGIIAIMIYIVLIRKKRQAQLVGEITALGFMMLAVSYFFITFLRGDTQIDELYFNLSYSQYFSLFLFFLGFIIFIIVRAQYKKKINCIS